MPRAAAGAKRIPIRREEISVCTVPVRDALDKMRRGLDGALGFDEVEMLGEQMVETSLCGLGQTCGVALLGALRNFRDRMEAELEPHRPIPAQHGMSYVTAPCIEARPSKVNVPRRRGARSTRSATRQ